MESRSEVTLIGTRRRDAFTMLVIFLHFNRNMMNDELGIERDELFKFLANGNVSTDEIKTVSITFAFDLIKCNFLDVS